MARADAKLAAAKAKWKSSGLTDAHARKLGFKAVSAKSLHSKFHDADALLIPYFDLKGKQTKFYRIRYLSKLPGAAGLAEKPQRYDQLPVMQEVYYPPLVDWEDLAKDTSKALCVTEGELKADCACANGIPMMALGGVYSFMSSKRGVPLLPSLTQIEWTERQVYIVYDNDIMHKPEIVRAQIALADQLLSRGAKISFISIPPGPEKGVDDFIVKHGVEAFAALINQASPYAEGSALWQMNEECVFIKKINTVIERATNFGMNPDHFVRHQYANRHYMQRLEAGSGKNLRYVMEKTPLAPRWMSWEGRAELSELTYEPGKPQVVDGRAWNTWTGWGLEPVKGDVAPWLWLMDYLFDGDPKTRKYFEQWCAYPIQNPGAKLYTACVLWSRVKRLGKSMVGLALSKIYGTNARFVESRELKSNFNSWARDRQLVIGEEITAGEARVDADYLKYIITHHTFTIRDLYRSPYDIPNHTNFLFLSNHPDAVFLEDGDKRYLIHGIRHNHPAPREKYEWIDKWLHGAGPSHLMYYLLNLSLKGFNPREHAPETVSKSEMVFAGKTDTGLWVMRLQEDPAGVLKALGQKPAEGCDLFTPDQLYHAYDPEGRNRGRSSVAGLGRQLASAGFRQVNGGTPVSTETGLHRLYAVRNQVKWEQSTRKEIKDHYNQFFGFAQKGAVK